MRFLVVKMSSMGDVVHAQPVAADLRARFPGSSIDWVVEQAFAPIVRRNPAVDLVLPIAWRRWRRRLFDAEVRNQLRAFVAKLRRTQYDWIIDCQGLLKSAAVVRLARGAHRLGLDRQSAREPLASLAYDRRVQVPRDWHVVRRNRAIAAEGLGYRTDDLPLVPLVADALSPNDQQWFPSSAPVVLVPGASRAAKLWPEARWIALAQRLTRAGASPVWFWGSADERARAERLAAAGGGRVVPDFLDVGRAASVLAASVGVVGLDTGFTHLAAALGRPTVGIFCDFDAVQCAVSGPAPCASLGGVGQVPDLEAVIEAAARCLSLAVATNG
ncbi:MAG: lipopolysaccharide heptosyltransferase I [Burkholderiaceae bacterium]